MTKSLLNQPSIAGRSPAAGWMFLKKNLLLRASDQAMYEAKGEGKNRVNVAVEHEPRE